MSDPVIGVHGKIPAHGDFLKQNLPFDFVEAWDHWIQQAFLASQEALGAQWLNQFVVSPIWRFAIPQGALGLSAWAGIMLPSVDKVGRYFPLTLACPIPDQIGVFEFMGNAAEWYDRLEDCAVEVLDQGSNIDVLTTALQGLQFSYGDDQSGSNQGVSKQVVRALDPQRNLQMSLSLGSSDDNVNSVTPLLCDALLQSHESKLSIWWTRGGENFDPVLLISEKLPRPTGYTAMLNGQWAQWHWPNLIRS